ncbi:MAG: nickel-responsive transcriptional regulator NikR [Candidatus Omnitrophica bacterium]|nr:nickel-responsive transcriptional regulator NikR [Candidatus Omnitrophota bacterium]MDD5436576.1 nickel-responsive transcriptional regulator NikR [Candidatus Omnitrophota bacterium]
MTGLVRFGISTEKDLLAKFDRLMNDRGYTNRSKAFSDLVRQELVKREWTEGKEVAGAIIMIYDHHKRELVNKLMDIQHDFNKVIMSTQHIHLDHDNCLEIVAIKGTAVEVQKLADILKSVRGVKHTTLGMSSTGKHI